ncbi:ScbR family autoregulator-binding transcription factor [Streptomyces sp. JNUCC 64]
MTKQHRALRTRQELIRSAAEVFNRAGFADSSIIAISSRAGVSNGAVHFHFGNKRALGHAVETAAAQALLNITGRVPLRHPAPLQLMVDTSHALAQDLLDDPVLRAGFRLGTDATWRGEGDLWEQWQDWVQLMLVVARDQGRLAPDAVVEDAVFAITAVMAGFELRTRTDARWCSREGISRFWKLTLPRLAHETAIGQLNPDGALAPVWTVDELRDGGWELTGDGCKEPCGVA